jgi:hypothetical protein
MKQTNNEPDCVGFKRRIQEQHYQQTRELEPDQEIDFFQRTAAEGPLGKWWTDLKQSQQHHVDRQAQRGGKP